MKLVKMVLLILLWAAHSVSMAGEIKTYDQKTFDQLAGSGKPVVLDVSAPWCPTCKQQKPIVDKLMNDPAYKDVTLLTIDFDNSKELLKKLKVSTQSTLIAFKGAKEVARSVGDTTPAGIEGLVKKTIQQ